MNKIKLDREKIDIQPNDYHSISRSIWVQQSKNQCDSEQ